MWKLAEIDSISASGAEERGRILDVRFTVPYQQEPNASLHCLSECLENYTNLCKPCRGRHESGIII